MADPKKRLTTNVPGTFFVDSTCINCDTCRQLSPATFEEVGEYSAVTRQPSTDIERAQAYQALVACPVGSIGSTDKDTASLQAATASFPLQLEHGVSYCGFNSDKSFGANSYFIEHPGGNWLMDSPRYTGRLVQAFERRGGVKYILLSHEDDVADADRYAKRFGAVRIIHREDSHAVPDAEHVLDGIEPVRFAPEFVIIPVPGHTLGSVALLYRERFLFTGDHLWWDRDLRGLDVPRNLVRNRALLRASAERLLDYRFSWVLPGHGDRVHLSEADMRRALEELVAGWRSRESLRQTTTVPME
jgi:glyoxylase-like metal-dependent hydrolase (beta-lactamase superfamily II)/ferredoxin